MTMKLKGKNFLKLADFTPDEINYLLELSGELKKKKMIGEKHKSMKGKNIALIFEKTSTRTRNAFIVSAMDEGAHSEFLGKEEIQLGKKESVKDTARILGRMFDGIAYRGYSQEAIEELGEYAGVPVWNALTDEYHPTQVLADLLTIKEKKGYLKGIKLAFLGDGRNNMANSLLVGGAKMGMEVRIVAPKELFPEEKVVKLATEIAEETGGNIVLTDDIDQGVKDVDFIYTDVWVSMGEEEKFEERINLSEDYTVDMEMIKKAKPDVMFMHCLPAFHNQETDIGKEVFERYGLDHMEVSEEVFESKYSIVFDQAENRVYTIRAVMVATIL